jgi:DNA replication protein DnaC
MDKEIKTKLDYLGLHVLLEEWDTFFFNAKKQKPSYHRFLTEIIEKEYLFKKEKARLSRIKRAKIPELFVMETYPFAKQPRLKKKLVFDLYDSLRFITEKQDLILIGPTGCGKTGIATSFLVHGINQGYRGRFIDFNQLIHILYQSRADHSEQKILKRFQSFDILLIDEVGYVSMIKEQAGLFFDLMKKRNRKQTTIITTQLGFDEWGSLLQDSHLTATLLDRITQHCTVFNMKECISLRPKNITMATQDKSSQ